MSSSLFRKVALFRWMIVSRCLEKSPGLILKSKKSTGSILEDESNKLSRNTGNKSTTSHNNRNINCITAKTLKAHKIFVFVAKSDIILRIDIRKAV
jgi:hypothetical protein